MAIRIPEHLERFVHDQVQAGRYSTEDEVISDALEQLRKHAQPIANSQRSLGAMQDAADQGLRITIAILGHMGSFVSRANPDLCPTVLRLFDSVVTNTANCYSRHII